VTLCHLVICYRRLLINLQTQLHGAKDS
jgi:hypothetical protein